MANFVKYLVCYDIPNNKLRHRFSEALKDFGLQPLQKSVFYGELLPAEYNAVIEFAKETLDQNVDLCLWFPCYLTVEEIRKCLGYSNFNFAEHDGSLFV